MEQDSLRERLAKLHAELNDAHQADPAARSSLGDVLPDLKRRVDQPSGSPADDSLPERLERVAVQFEAEHPKLAASTRRLIALLSEVGI